MNPTIITMMNRNRGNNDPLPPGGPPRYPRRMVVPSRSHRPAAMPSVAAAMALASTVSKQAPPAIATTTSDPKHHFPPSASALVAATAHISTIKKTYLATATAHQALLQTTHQEVQ